MIIFAGIDGTSSETGTENMPGGYQQTFLNSFVNRLQRNEVVRFADTWYLRGPYTSGLDTADRAKRCYDWVSEQWKTGKAKAIFLGGYSRGAAAVLEVSKWLKERDNIPVECLIMFDAVDRTNTIGDPTWTNTKIPSTVGLAIHPMRNIKTTLSRLSFGWTGTYRESSATAYFENLFFATHGGLGGVPWSKATHPIFGTPTPTIWEFGEVSATFVTPGRDMSGSDAVWAWVRPHIATAFARCKARLDREASKPDKPDFRTPESTMPGGGVGSKLPPTGDPKGQPPRYYVVKSGDWLSKIAQKYYGDPMKYDIIHRANPHIGPDADKIEVGQRLLIPYI
jgi:LysM domain